MLGYLTPDEVYYKGLNNKCYNAKDVLQNKRIAFCEAKMFPEKVA